MPELPEVEVLARHLRPLIRNQTIRGVVVRRAKVLAPTTVRGLKRALLGARFTSLARRGKYLLFGIRRRRGDAPVTLLGHLGMTGRIHLARQFEPLPKHAAVVLDLGRDNFIFEDTRYFGRFTLDTAPLARLGPEPFDAAFTAAYLAGALARSAQPIKVRLLDQALVAGIGNIYASEILFRVCISPKLSARKLTLAQVRRLRLAIRRVLAEAIDCGSTVPLNFGGHGRRDGLFYFGRAPATLDYYTERLRVYDRAGRPCPRCGAPIKRIVQAARSTFYCPDCQR